MERITKIRQRLNSNEPINKIQADIIVLMKELIDEREKTFGYWEKCHFAYAISAFAWNMNKSCLTKSWLYLCLSSLEKACVLSGERNESYNTTEYADIKKLTSDQLIEEINILEQKHRASLGN